MELANPAPGQHPPRSDRQVDSRKTLRASGISNGTPFFSTGQTQLVRRLRPLWQLKYYGHKDVRLINGGRKKVLERTASFRPKRQRSLRPPYHVSATDESLRAHKEEVFAYS